MAVKLYACNVLVLFGGICFQYDCDGLVLHRETVLYIGQTEPAIGHPVSGHEHRPSLCVF